MSLPSLQAVYAAQTKLHCMGGSNKMTWQAGMCSHFPTCLTVLVALEFDSFFVRVRLTTTFTRWMERDATTLIASLTALRFSSPLRSPQLVRLVLLQSARSLQARLLSPIRFKSMTVPTTMTLRLLAAAAARLGRTTATGRRPALLSPGRST